jgi:BirA family biotin operon repressor/biotin-[acetyl-CoA-carboxylase] ligase
MEKDYNLKIIFYDLLDSTQLYLKKLVKEGSIDSSIMICANIQTNGIGSRNNSWKGLEGNLFFSFALEKDYLPKDLKIESISIYFSYLFKEILTTLGSDIWIKWPNDFYLGNQKIGGLMTNIVGDFIVCGVGLNLKNAPDGFATLDIKVTKEKLLEKYKDSIEKKLLWKQVFSKYRLEFSRNKDFFTHKNGLRVSLSNVTLEDDGSLSINGERMYSLR